MRHVRVVVGALVIAVVVLVLATGPPPSIVYLGGLYLALPIGFAAAVVTLRRYSPPKAALAGALITFGTIAAVYLPLIFAIAILGGYDSGPDCDGFCTTTTSGLIIALLLLVVSAVPAAIAGGIISAIASLVGVRPARDA